METARLYNTLLRLNYEDLLQSCSLNPQTQAICRDPVFWEDKAQQDFGLSLRQVEGERYLTPREKYLAILSRRDVVPGSEQFADVDHCLRQAIIKGRSDLACYFVENAGADAKEALIEAAKDKALFDQLRTKYQIDIYSDRVTLYYILMVAIKNKNVPLLREIAPQASSIITSPAWQEELLNQAAKTGDYDFIDYVHDYFHLGDAPELLNDEWFLQAALLKDDQIFAEELITRLLNQRQYESLIRAFVRAGDYERLENIIHLVEFEGLEYLGRDILLNAARYDRLSMVRLVVEDPVFRLVRRRSWFEQALDTAKTYKNLEVETYLTNILREM